MVFGSKPSPKNKNKDILGPRRPGTKSSWVYPLPPVGENTTTRTADGTQQLEHSSKRDAARAQQPVRSS